MQQVSTTMVDQAEKLRQIIRESQGPGESVTLNRLIMVLAGQSKTGATSFTINLALAMARSSNKVAVADLNFSNPQLADSCRIRFPSRAAAIQCETRLGRELLCNGPCGIGFLPLYRSKRQETHESEELCNYVEDSFVALHESHTLVADAGVELHAVNRRLCELATEIIVLTEQDPKSIVEAYSLIKQLGTHRTAARIYTVVNRSQSEMEASSVHQRLHQSCDQFLNLHVCELGTISHDSRFTQAFNAGRPLMLQAPHSLTSMQFNEIAECLQNQYLARQNALKRINHLQHSTTQRNSA